MDSLCNLQKALWILMTLWNGLLVAAANELEICQPKNQSIAGQLHIKTPGFPHAWTGHIKCRCYIEGQDIAIATRTLVLSSASVLEVFHDDQGNKSSWLRDSSLTVFDKLNRKLVIARNATEITISIDTSATKGPANALTLFMFDFQANEEMSVWCENLTSPDTTEDKDTPNTTKDEDNSLLEQIGSVCSPHFVIILGSLCCALLLIILIISIILCCIVPKKRKTYTIDYRNQQVTDEKKLRKAAKDGRESIIYDEAKVNLGASAAYNNTMYAENRQHNYSNTGSQLLQRSNTVPAPCTTRQSAQYVNSVLT